MNKLEELEKKYEELGKEIDKLKNEERYPIVHFNGFEWYKIKEDEKGALIVMKDYMPKNIIREIFRPEMRDSYDDVRFSLNGSNRWIDSPIRMTLNSAFLNKFNISDLLPMETNVNGTTVTDYVRLLTKEEVESFPLEIKKINYEYGYWLLSPYSGNSTYAFRVGSTGYVHGNYVGTSDAVRPAVYVKSSVINAIR